MCQATLFGALALPQEEGRAQHAAPLQRIWSQAGTGACPSKNGCLPASSDCRSFLGMLASVHVQK